MSFGENLIKLRRQKGWSQDDLANNLDLSRQAISKWENNTSKPDIDNLKKISNIFSIKIDELVNNEIPDNKAVTLDVKKEEKKEKTITIVKLIIIAVIILYVISVIYKFCSLLIIVNGVQKYANLNNYHYVITTYDENGLVEKEECWFKDGVSKTENTVYSNLNKSIYTLCIDYNNNYGYKFENEGEDKNILDDAEYGLYSKEYSNGNQMLTRFPAIIYKYDYANVLSCLAGNIFLDIYENGIIFNTSTNNINIDKNTFFPITLYDKEKNIVMCYEINLNSVEELKI